MCVRHDFICLSSGTGPDRAGRCFSVPAQRKWRHLQGSSPFCRLCVPTLQQRGAPAGNAGPAPRVMRRMSDSSHDPLEPESVRARLGAERTATVGQIAALGRDFDAIVEANALVAVDDEHDPEGSSTAFERAHVASLLSQARSHLDALDQALVRLEQGDYGTCTVCGEPIPAGRLEARPAATTCVRCAAGA